MAAWLIAAIAILTAGVTSAFLRFYHKGLKSLEQQLIFLLDEDTNKKVTTPVPLPAFEKVSRTVNQILEKHRQTELRIKGMDQDFKDTITNISHDLRTPLTSAQGYLQMMADAGLSADKKKRYMKIIQERIYAVQAMLDQLFLYARIEAGELALDSLPVSLNNILRDTVSLFYEDFRIKRQEPQISVPDLPFVVHGDEEALRRIFSNILRNALEHGEGDFSVCSAVDREKEGYSIVFRNRTQSITDADMERIFDRFYTSDVSRNKKTTGLGLSIAKRLTEKMGGTIRASLEGAIFSVTLHFPT